MSAPASQVPDVRAEPRGPHWIAWVADENGRPAGSVVLVGQTQEEAENRAREWAGSRSLTPR